MSEVRTGRQADRRGAFICAMQSANGAPRLRIASPIPTRNGPPPCNPVALSCSRHNESVPGPIGVEGLGVQAAVTMLGSDFEITKMKAWAGGAGRWKHLPSTYLVLHGSRSYMS